MRGNHFITVSLPNFTQAADLLFDPVGSGAAVNLLAFNRLLDGQIIEHVLFNFPGNFLELLQRQLLEGFSGIEAERDGFAGDLVRLPERHVLQNQVIGQVGGG